jgi:hypothetical protein
LISRVISNESRVNTTIEQNGAGINILNEQSGKISRIILNDQYLIFVVKEKGKDKATPMIPNASASRAYHPPKRLVSPESSAEDEFDFRLGRTPPNFNIANASQTGERLQLPSLHAAISPTPAQAQSISNGPVDQDGSSVNLQNTLPEQLKTVLSNLPAFSTTAGTTAPQINIYNFHNCHFHLDKKFDHIDSNGMNFASESEMPSSGNCQ